jgi:hypothetical protein
MTQLSGDGYATELMRLAAVVAQRHPEDEHAQRVAEYAEQVVRDHAELAPTVRDALEGDSNDAEHDALVAVAEAFAIRYTADLAEEVEDLGWPSVADDLREGVPRATVLARLDKIPGVPPELRELLEP